jgi:hypothetical protein
MDAGIGEAALLSTLAAEGGSAAIGAGALGAGEMAGIAGLTGLGELGSLGFLGEGTAMGMIPEAAAIPGLSAYTPTLQAVAPEAFTQGMNAVQASGTPNFASMMSGPSEMVGNSMFNTPYTDAGKSLFLSDPGAVEGTRFLSDPSILTGAAPISEASALAAVGQPTSMAEMAQLANRVGPTGALPEAGGFNFKDLASAYNAVPKELRYAGIGYSALQALNADKNKYGTPTKEKYSGPLSKFQYDPSRYVPTTTPQPTPYTPTRYAYAEGGIASLGGYSDGGRMLKGPGDGMSDSIPATISNKQPARLADGEFVVPADVVSHLGNGSTDAGAKQLYKMMDKVRVARTGKKMQGRQINPRKYVPA